MKLSDFDFFLPEGLIAGHPAEPRDSSRLLVIGDGFSERKFNELPSLIQPNDLLVFNNSKVIPARLYAQSNGREFEILLHRKKAQGHWTAFIRGSKKLKTGDELVVGELKIKILSKDDDGEIEVELSNDSLVHKYGHMPLPPYIKRADSDSDKIKYQTVYAKTEGSVAAPTAGLHFTEDLLAKIPNKAFVTLHVGAGTFQPVKTENVAEHKMHSEWYEISPETEAAVKQAKQSNGRIIAVGTTSCRVLESSGGKAGCGETDIFITPGYEFRVVDAMITNFHLPKSTLFMLVSALAGTDKMKQAYGYAIEKKFRFFSYGDACFIA